ncbi:MAG: hypothetical protein K2J20_01890, partial [Bacilli bacterium]|nr:hypothetical protein [Bacilli bacterium]
YNIYHLCKQNIKTFQNIYINKFTDGTCRLENWGLIKEKLTIIRRIPSLTKYADDYYNSVPVFIRDNSSLMLSETLSNELNLKRKAICDKMKTIIDLYESMKISDGGTGIDIKMPPCDDLKAYISYLKDIEFIFSQCPFFNVKMK